MIDVMLAYVTETVCEVSCSALLVAEVLLLPMWDISREGCDSTMKVNFWTLHT